MDGSAKKRKANGESRNEGQRTSKLQKKSSKSESIPTLEAQIIESQKHLNNVATILSIAKSPSVIGSRRIEALTSLCRVFIRLRTEGRLDRPKSSGSESQLKVVEWLKARFNDYKALLLEHLIGTFLTSPDTILILCFQIVRNELENSDGSVAEKWRRGFFVDIVSKLLESDEEDVEEACDKFVEEYANKYDDVRHYVFPAIVDVLSRKENKSSNATTHALDILSQLSPPTPDEPLTNLFHTPTSTTKIQSKPITYTIHRRLAQKAWLSVLSSSLNLQQRKQILTHMTSNILPWLPQPNLLMDFLTDSFNESGSTSLLALHGLFHLITTYQLDYPDFYRKLYSLLDTQILHSKHRSRFLRLLEQCLQSTHLPATLVASFIKRLSRLSLSAPPGAIVAIVPFVYNLLKSHPQTTFTLHRPARSTPERELNELDGAEDTFDMSETDPTRTGAIDSCLWELWALRKHFQPNVAGLCNIIGEPFYKERWNVEDFLDYSYASLIDAELGKAVKKEPVVEYKIPKRIFVTSSIEGGVEEEEDDDSVNDRLEGMMCTIMDGCGDTPI